MHGARDLKSLRVGITARKKQPLDFRGQLDLFQQRVSLVASKFVQSVSLCDKPLQNQRHESESDQRRQIVQDASLNMMDRRAKEVMEENTKHDQRIRQARRKENRAKRKRQYVKVAERNAFHHVVGISDTSDGQHHHQEGPPT